MLLFIKQKIKNQIWLSLCLVLGLSLLVAVFCCQAMFQEGCLDNLLQTKFSEYIESRNQYPGVIGRTGSFYGENVDSLGKMTEVLDTYQAAWRESLADIPVLDNQRSFSLYESEGQGEYLDSGMYYESIYMPQIESHIEIVDGEALSDAGDFTCIITEKVMDIRRFTLGEKITFDNYLDKNGNPLQLTIAGVFRVVDEEDTFWLESPYLDENDLYVSKASFERMLADFLVERVIFKDRILLDTNAINSNNFDHVKNVFLTFRDEDPDFVYASKYIVDNYDTQRWTIFLMLVVLGLPILGMVFPFIYMVSAQIASKELSEVAMLKSRGILRKQVVFLYFVRTCVLAGISVFAGFGLAVLLCKIASSATNFLEFDFTQTTYAGFYPILLVYALVAVLLGIGCIMLPVLKNSKVSIVEYKANYSQGKKMAWEKFFVDIILMALSLYLVFVYKRFIGILREEISFGSLTDPLVFLDTCIFVIAAALFSYRITRYFVTLVYKIGKKRWKTVAYTAFLQITRTSRKQMFISIFMVVTVALGLFYANGARTMNQNKVERIRYVTGTEDKFKEKWEGRPYMDASGNKKVLYTEPDFDRFSFLDDFCDYYAKVVRQETVYVSAVFGQYSCQLMAIDPDQFGPVAYLKEELQGDTHWYNYLNALAENPEGAIISSNVAKEMNVEVGRTIQIQEDTHGGTGRPKYMYCKVVAIVDAWPAFDQYSGKTENRLVVVNRPIYYQKMEVWPYEIWTDLKEGVTPDDLKKELANREFNITCFERTDNQIQDMKSSFMVKITNGMFSLSFLIALTLCGIGFLIYWVSSIEQRELLFGVYRAMGLSVKEINRMLIYEHIFSTFLSVLSGAAVGMATTFLFAEVFAVVYLPEKSCVPVQVYYELPDIVRLFVIILLVILLCLGILRRQVKKLNIAQALKLGED